MFFFSYWILPHYHCVEKLSEMLRIKHNEKRFLLPPANEVWGKVIFSQASVILFTGEGVSLTETHPLDRHPPGQRPPQTETSLDRDPRDRDPLDRDPLGQRPPGQRPPWRDRQTPLDRDPPGQRPPGQRPPRDKDPSGQRPPGQKHLLDKDTLYGKERAVLILLECILVAALIDVSKASFFTAAVCVSNDD